MKTLTRSIKTQYKIIFVSMKRETINLANAKDSQSETINPANIKDSQNMSFLKP